MNRTNRWKSTFYPLLFGFGTAFSTPFLLADAPLETSENAAVWRPASNDEFEWDRRFAEELLNRGFRDLANVELERLETRLETASAPALFRFGATAIRAFVETSRLSSPADRADVAKKIAAIREKIAPALERGGTDEPLSDEERSYRLAPIRAYFELGVLDAEEQTAETAQNSVSSGGESPYFEDAFELSKNLVARSNPADVRPFVYWGAKTLLAQVALAKDVKNESTVEKLGRIEQFAAALENASPKSRDEFYFLAQLLRIESARIQGDVDAASARIGETLKELDGAEPELAAAFNAVLVAEETRLLALEGKTDDALRLAFGNVDLLGRPFSPNVSSQFDALLDAADVRNFANAELFWNAAASADSNAPNGEDGESQPTKERLIESAKTASANLSSNFWQTRAARLVRNAAQNGSDWRTSEAAANENYRRSLWENALADFDRAASEAAVVGAAADAFRLACSAAAIVDKINRDKTFETDELLPNDPVYWRSEAVRRFESLSRSRPDDPISPRLFLLALEYSQELPTETSETQTARRLDYLRLFPAAKNRDLFACDAARRALADNRFDDAAAFLDFVPSTAPELPTALDLECRLVRERIEKDGPQTNKNVLFAATVRRLLAKTTGANEMGGPASFDANASVETLISAAAQNLTSDSASDGEALIFETIFELAFSVDATKNDAVNAALETLLNRWESALSNPSNAEKVKIDSLRLTLWLDAKKTDKILKYVVDVERSTPDAATETLERLLNFAENTSLETKKSIGGFVLSALDSTNASVSNGSNVPKNADDGVRRDLVRARALQLIGKSQEALELFATLRQKNPQNVAAVRGLAVVLTENSSPAALERALRFWSDVADLVRVDSPDWWDAKERCVEIYSRLGRKDQAAKMTKTIWLTRSDPSDPERRQRWENLCR